MYKYFLIALIICSCPCYAEDDADKNIIYLQEILKNTNKINANLMQIDKKLFQLAQPKWEYKIIVPNLLNSPDGKQVIDGIDFYQLGRQGWELISYTDNYGFIFKRRCIKN